MWIGHYASAFIAKTIAPGIPLSVLALSSSAADALFFLLNFAGLESFNLDQSIVARSGCFPYTNDYPYSHSLAGMGVAGALVALDVKLTPHDDVAAGAGWFDSPATDSLWFYTRFAPKAQFCFTAAPTQEARWVHAPLFLSMILGSSYLLGKLES
ncbi:uncharacterized protein B0H18DRAFT_1148837 [Fomitopsis serialis]|uniref:uncharacterized protein n=1 Tax=Fomitopsis serialis TaxID=139415 RepID=UPI002008701F|nr:uncharacterized protein B0H18DRAFT_1148837 [Neoantrodia serialis]KAH9929748.1 hypothetical protein B0H18DRAFT_1148837 [Neoantrodia serialis]